MPKNYKRRGYPGKELKKQKQDIENRSDYVLAYGAYGFNKHERDCELERLKEQVETLRYQIAYYKNDVTNIRLLCKKERKEKVTLERKVKALRRHIKDITPKRQPLIQSTALARAIKHI